MLAGAPTCQGSLALTACWGGGAGALGGGPPLNIDPEKQNKWYEIYQIKFCFFLGVSEIGIDSTLLLNRSKIQQRQGLVFLPAAKRQVMC